MCVSAVYMCIYSGRTRTVNTRTLCPLPISDLVHTLVQNGNMYIHRTCSRNYESSPSLNPRRSYFGSLRASFPSVPTLCCSAGCTRLRVCESSTPRHVHGRMNYFESVALSASLVQLDASHFAPLQLSSESYSDTRNCPPFAAATPSRFTHPLR